MLARLSLISLVILAACGNSSNTQVPATVIKTPITSLFPISTSVTPLSVVVHTGYTPFDTGFNSEMTQNIPITNGSGDYAYQTLFSVALQNINQGDILQYSAQGEITDNAGITALLGSKVDLSNGPLPSDMFYQIGFKTGYNVTAEMHHAVLPPMTNSGYVFTDSYAVVYLNVIVYSGSTDAKDSQYLNVNLGHGRLSGLVIRQ